MKLIDYTSPCFKDNLETEDSWLGMRMVTFAHLITFTLDTVLLYNNIL